jgi:hypothetical protein
MNSVSPVLAPSALFLLETLIPAGEVPGTMVAPGPELATIASGPSAERWFAASDDSRPFLLESREGLADSDLAPELREVAGRMIDSSLAGVCPAWRTADLIWWVLAIDFFQRIPGSSPPRRHESGLTFRCPVDALKQADDISLPQRFGMITGFLGQARSLYEASAGEAVVHVPRLSSFESAANAVSAGPAHLGLGGISRWRWATGELPRDTVNGSHLTGRPLIALPLREIYLSHALRMVRPFLFAAHDLYHAVRVATLPAPLVQMGAGLYEAIRSLDGELKDLPFVEPMMDVLSDLDLKTGLCTELIEVAFGPFRRACEGQGKLPPERARLYRRFLMDVLPPWRPYLHESRRDSVEKYLDQLQTSLT